MTTRREFLQFSAAGLGTLALSELSFAALKPFPIGVQLYTVRDQAEKDLGGTLAHINMIGYKTVETYWNVYTHPAKELKKMIVDNGLSNPSGHFNYEGMDSKLDYAKELGVQYVICPMLPKDMWTSADGFKKAADQFNKSKAWECSSDSIITTMSFRSSAAQPDSTFLLQLPIRSSCAWKWIATG